MFLQRWCETNLVVGRFRFMIKLKSIFAVSVLAMLVVVDAHADIASKGYVDEQVSNVTIDVDAALSSSSTNPVQNKVINSALAAKQNADTAVTHTANTAVGDSSHPVYVNASGAAVKIDKVAAASTADRATKATQDGNGANIASTYAKKTELPTKTSELTNDSNFVTADELPDDYTLPVATASALGGVKSGGDITVSSTGTVTVNSATTADSATTATSATKATQDGNGRNIANTYVVKAQGSTAASKAVVTDPSGNITTGTIASGMIASGAVTSAKLGDDAVTAAKIASGAVGSDALASGAVTSAKIADGTIVNADINANAAISASKIAGLADVATSGSYDDLTDAPTIPTVNNATLTIQKNGTNVATFTANSATAATANITVPTKTSELTNDSDFATTAQVNALDSTTTGTGAVVTNVSQTDGKVSVTKGNVQIPVGGESATTYAKIWVE